MMFAYMAFASHDELKHLYDTSSTWLRQYGEGSPATNLESGGLQPDGYPVTAWPASYAARLSGNEVWGIAPQAARTLHIDGTAGALELGAVEGAHQRHDHGGLEFFPAAVLFSVMFPPGASLEETMYRIRDPESADMAPTTEIFVREGVERDFLAMQYGEVGALLGLTPEQYLEGIESGQCSALQQVVDALANHWPAILKARRQQ